MHRPDFPEFIITKDHFLEIHQKFEEYTISKGYVENYGKEQVNCIREFLFKMEEKELTEIKQIKSSHIRSYHRYLSQRRNRRRKGGLSARMIEHHIQSLKNFFRFLQRDGIITDNPMTTLRFKKQITKPRAGLDYEYIEALYKATITLREKAILHIYYACGLRRSECELLNMNDIHFEKKLLIVREGKFGKRRVVPMQESVAADLQNYILYERQAYLRKSSNPKEEALLLTHAGRRMPGARTNVILKEIVRRLPKTTQKKIGNLHPHLLRHSIATHLMNNGMGMESLSEFLGHASLDATQIYVYGNAHFLKQKYKLQRQTNAREYKEH